jgi:hypothetical protein
LKTFTIHHFPYPWVGVWGLAPDQNFYIFYTSTRLNRYLRFTCRLLADVLADEDMAARKWYNTRQTIELV